ncbi:hypothetical protein [Mycolicibacterium komossense]|jgi:hypothetical protein|uniref:Transmembrane protein n=1 Tax=Mycolicibacterium komossense TaxID=1779 RepID=A0ABT3C6K7_9MYCO|nr:hypothetical protein [Mycolicibacterium komossense]MCV7225102.1 hypothetical protein [Mycolicibacterium komossense]
MLIVALILAVVGLAALVTAVVTSNELVAWVCIGASVIGVILLIIDAIRERQHVDNGTAVADDAEPGDAVGGGEAIDETYKNFDAEYPDEDAAAPEAEGHTESLETVTAEQAAPEETPPARRPESS